MKKIFFNIKNLPFLVALSIFFMLLVAVSCQQSKNDNYVKNAELQSYNDAEAPNNHAQVNNNTPKEKKTNSPSTLETVERKIIKTGDIRFRTSDLNQTRNAIAQAVQTFKGYVSEENQSGYNATSEMRLIVRIPAQSFDSLMSIITTHAIYFDSKIVNSQDVTEEFIDVSARLKTKKALENQYIDLLKKAHNIKDIMEIERELNNVRTEIESAEGRLRYLSNQVTFSTLNIAFYKESAHKVRQGFWSRLGDSFIEGWYSLLDFFVGLASLWAFLLAAIAVFWLLRRIWLMRKKSIK